MFICIWILQLFWSTTQIYISRIHNLNSCYRNWSSEIALNQTHYWVYASLAIQTCCYMTCTSSMCLSKMRKNPRLYSAVVSYFSLSLSLSLSLLFSTWVCICVWLLLIRKCVLVFNLYTASSACVRKGNVLGFVSVYIRTHNIILHLLLSSSSFSVYPKKVPCSSFFVSARHPIDTFAIQQKKYFYYSHILHLGSWILLAFDKWFEKFRILLKIYKPF